MEQQGDTPAPAEKKLTPKEIAEEKKLQMLYKINQDLLTKADTLLKENDDLTKLFEAFKENANNQENQSEGNQLQRREAALNQRTMPEKGRTNSNANSSPVNLNPVEMEREMHKIQKEKQNLENLFVEINIDIHNKRKELEDMNKHMELARNTVKKIDLEIVAKTEFINFLESQYREEK